MLANQRTRATFHPSCHRTFRSRTVARTDSLEMFMLILSQTGQIDFNLLVEKAQALIYIALNVI